jgi:hypothetical protein
LRRAQNDLYYLAHKLGYDWSPQEQQGLTEEFHGPLCARSDRLRAHLRVGLFCQRKGLKSSVFTICLGVQEILIDPDITIMICHAVEEEAEALLQEMGGHFQENEWLRSLDPVGVYPEGYMDPEVVGKTYRIMPTPGQVKGSGPRKFLKTGSFTVRRAGHKPTTKRQPTCRAKGAGAEITGAHVDLFFLDDIIGLKDLEESTGMAKKTNWWKKTSLNVLNALGRVRLVGTRWDENDFYAPLFKSKDWDIVVRHARETDGKMDYKGDPTHYGPGTSKVPGGIEAARKREEAALREMGQADYAAQRMNDPSPQTERPWVTSECEHIIPREKAVGQGVIFVLSDPAPKNVGSASSEGEKKRGDGTKNFWAIAVVKLRTVGQLRQVILLDGAASQDWEPEEGLDVICEFATRYHGAYVYNENYGFGAAYSSNDLRRAQVRNGVRLKIPDVKQSYAARAKNIKLARLAEKAKNYEFLICESCPKDFLEPFLDQMRQFRPLPLGRNNLRFDDHADAVSMSCMEGIQTYAPRVDLTRADPQFSPFRPQPEEDQGRSFGRRIRA